MPPPTPDNPGHLIVHRGSRTERLAAELARQLEAQRPANPLAAQTVVVAHPGLQRWLLGRLAHRHGAHGEHGIAANFDMILPWQWFERCAHRVLGEDALVGGAYRHELLRWRLPTALPMLKSAEVAAYLAGDDSGRRRFQLAEHLAGVYTQYLLYRPEWILAWEQPDAHDPDWQATLWRQLQAAIQRPHRARRSAALLDALAADPEPPAAPLHVFGVSHLPPDVMQALQVTAQRTPVHLYFPDPCREYWSDLRSRRFQLKQAGDPDALYYEIGHPLLVALGRIAQDFCISLDACDAIELRDPLDEAEPLPDTHTLLARLQSSIRCLQPDLVGAPIREQAADPGAWPGLLPALRHDASLRVHACHTRLRELEVLKDALLRCLADHPELQHRDIVVMAPDISAYAPCLAAVFGEPAKYRDDPAHIPWHLADVGMARMHPLLGAFDQVLDLAESRFTVSEVLDLLDVPALARRFAIDGGARDALESWLHRAHVAWGLDAAMKAESGAQAIEANSWQFGLDRMYAGLIVGDAGADQLLDGILPLPGVSGGATEALGQLDRLLGELRRARAAFAGERPLAGWSEWLLQLIDALFLADPRDEAENHALDALRRLAADLGNQAAETGLVASLSWSVVREALRGALGAVPERQPFLLGGVTFCGLVPQRSIPFRVVCLLGMNEGEFPRAGQDAGINRMLAQPRPGDRDTRNEDRYLFLEALMSAREVLHVSYIGEGVRDGKPRNPAAPLAELLQFLDEQYGIAGAGQLDRPWLVRHPLQPFDARYYERDADGEPRHDPRLFSYEPAFVAIPSSRAEPRFLDSRADIATDTSGEISLDALHRFWRDPARAALLRGHGISLQALDESGWPDREPLETGLARIERIDRQLLFEALADGTHAISEAPPAWLAGSGLLAGGAIGERTWSELRAQLQPLLDGARPLFADGRAQRLPQAIDLDLGDGLRLTGSVERVFRGATGGPLLFDLQAARTAGLKDLLGYYIDWAVLQLSRPGVVQGDYLEPGSKTQPVRQAGLLQLIHAQQHKQLRHGLRTLIGASRSAAQQPLLFFPKTALAWAIAKPDERAHKARAAWEGDGRNQLGERDYAPGYAALLTRGLDLFDSAGSGHRRFVTATETVCHVLDPLHTALLKPGNRERSMTATTLPILDWRRMPLQGRVLIEASAGTGKTWNIGVIYLRLLLECGLSVEKILVTTFTDAAAQELRERLRRRLVEAEHLLESGALDAASDNQLEAWLTALCTNEEQTRQALRRIKLARTDLDRAPVSTIHAFCQRVQRDYPLESGATFAGDKLFDESQLQRECVEDFWRRRYLAGAVDPREAELLLQDGPEGLLSDLGGLGNSTDARIESGGLAELERQIAVLETPENILELQRLIEDVALYKRSNAALRSRLAEIVEALQHDDEAQLATSLSEVFEPEKLAAQESPAHAGELSGHPLILALQALRPLLGLRDVFTRGAVLADAACFCREEIPRRARQRHVLTFSMLIDVVYQRLCGSGAGNRLADRLYEAFPAALIDEFQDTDQRQFAIFDRIYRARGALVMIGDPKQAIYSFRGGDIAAYLRAAEQADHRYSLGTNYRSSAALVGALNAWYAHVDGGFEHPQIRYQHVTAAGETDHKPHTVDNQAVSRPLVIHPFRGEATDRNGRPLGALAELESLALDDCANRIAQLLNDPRQQIAGTRVGPGDIAVLLSTNPQIGALRERLLARGVPCVGSGRGNVFSGALAGELDLLLFAVLHPDDDQAVRGALATRLLGITLAQFTRWQEDPDAFEQQLERFEGWRALVRQRGVLALIGNVLATRATDLLALPEGERLLTDLRHLGELLAEQESLQQGLDGLHAWLRKMRLEGGDGDTEAADERQLRIESDARRVQLLTIHASKGLEFPIVFLPLAWRIRTSNGKYAPKLLRYHDATDQRCVDLGSADFIVHRARHFHEDLQERLRLLYVGMTRAVHGLHVYWVDRGPLADGDDQAWNRAAIDLLIGQAQRRLELTDGEPSLDVLASRLDGIRIASPFADEQVSYQAAAEGSSPRATQAPLPRLRPFQWLHSFSGLSRYAAAAATVDVGDNLDEPESAPPVTDAADSTEDPRLLSLYPLRGPRFGDAVHKLFELARPGPLWPDQRQLLRRELTAQAIRSDAMEPDAALERVGRMVDRARHADLGDGLRLADVAPDRRIVEFEFEFPVQRVSLAQLRQLCIAHGCAGVIPASLDTATLNGMLTGFADLILAHQGCFHVLDYKTNWLGPRLDDYRGAALDAAMAEHHYPLQALIYSVALHRYLRQRMDGYTAEQHLGDSRYLFVRALGLGPELGVWRKHWPHALIEALDDAFAGVPEASA